MKSRDFFIETEFKMTVKIFQVGILALLMLLKISSGVEYSYEERLAIGVNELSKKLKQYSNFHLGVEKLQVIWEAMIIIFKKLIRKYLAKSSSSLAENFA